MSDSEEQKPHYWAKLTKLNVTEVTMSPGPSAPDGAGRPEESDRRGLSPGTSLGPPTPSRLPTLACWGGNPQPLVWLEPAEMELTELYKGSHYQESLIQSAVLEGQPLLSP